MARQTRRRYHRRTPQNLTWQPAYVMTRLVIPAGTAGATMNGVFAYTSPGTVAKDGTIDAFDDTHVLERIRGAVAHDANGIASTNTNEWFAMILAAAKIPKGLDVPSDGLDLFASEEIEDVAFRLDTVCNAGNAQNAVPTWHPLDSKAKRRLEVGDRLAWLWSLIRPTASTFNVDICMNMRLLWKLKI